MFDTLAEMLFVALGLYLGWEIWRSERESHKEETLRDLDQATDWEFIDDQALS